MAKEELPDWFKPSTPDDVLVEEPLQPNEPEWLQLTWQVIMNE